MSCAETVQASFPPRTRAPHGRPGLYSRMSRSWAARLPRLYDVIMAPFEAMGLRAMRARLWADVPRTGLGLEIGAGSGASDGLASSNVSLVRTDLSEAMLRRARGADAPTPSVVADVQALPFRAGTFEFAVGSLLFCEVPDPPRGLSELRRVLRARGSLHLLEHVEPRGALLASAARGLTRVTGPLFGEHFDRLTHETVAAAGFTMERAEWRWRGGVVEMHARRADDTAT